MDKTNLTEFQQYLYDQHKETSEMRSKFGREFLTIFSNANKSRIELSKHITMLTVGLLAVGVFWQTGSLYAKVGFGFALITIVFTVFFLRERIDQEGREAVTMIKVYNAMFDKYLSIILAAVKKDNPKEYFQNLNNFLEKDPDFLNIQNNYESSLIRNEILDYGGEVVNFLFLSTLTFYVLAFLSIQFNFILVVLVITLTFSFSVFETASFILRPLNRWLNKNISRK